MAYAALVSVSQTLEQILDSNPYFFPCTKENIESFRQTIASLIVFLDNSPPTCTQIVNNLITRIRDSTYQAEDIFESLVATHFLQKYGSDSYEKFKVFPQSLEKVMEDIESIEKEVSKIHHGGNGAHEQKIPTLASSSRPSVRVYNTKMMALDKDLEVKLMEQLVGERSKIDVIPIVGMGGIGKTTLARILYNSQLSKDRFDIRGWVTISQTYIVQEIVLGLLNDIGVPSDGKGDGKKLYQSLYDRKYLIVLDDVWNTQAWDDIKRFFPENNNGSRIILTTRHSKVAASANYSSTYHEMHLLNEDSSWSLLCQEIFLKDDSQSELVEIGKEIARQCRGLPLAVSAIGGYLKVVKQTVEYWKHVSENVSSIIRTTDNPSLEILTLSYNYLPHHLKACFLYFGSFQEDHSINVSRLVKLWAAEGFIRPCTSNSMEQVAEEYLQDLIDRNLVFVYQYDSFRKPKMCGIHDLFRDICIKEAKKEKFLYILNRDVVPFDFMEINSQRRLILSPNITEYDGSPCSSIVSRDGRCSAIRSFIRPDNLTSSTITLALGMVKVLNIRIVLINFPVEILELVNIKYLELIGGVFKIPSSISRLKNLQTLIAELIDVDSMPSEFWEMAQLRHLQLGSFSLPDIPDVQGKGTDKCILESLQTISYILNFSCTQEVLSRIPNLKKLEIFCNSYFESSHLLKNLGYFCKLESLRCSFNCGLGYYFDFGSNDNVLMDLAFPVSPKELVLAGCEIPWKHMTIIGSLPNLKVLELRNRAMEGKLWEMNDEEFEQLEFLLIQDSDPVEWKTEKGHFPSLRHLILRHCTALQEIPSEIADIPTLAIIEVDQCSPEVESSAKEILREDSDNELKIVFSKKKNLKISGLLPHGWRR